jgi:FAD/FMN-containing dehydrogenase
MAIDLIHGDRAGGLDDGAVGALGATIRGELIRPGDERYDDARRVWNGMVDKRPAIARCTGVADIVEAVTFAQEQGLLVAVRGGGHNVAGNAVCDDGIVIDLSGMKGVRVDPAAGTARTQPGVTWGDFDRETQLFGLATTGFVSTTGIAGLTLGGGIGWLGRKHGTASDNLLSVDVVTARGEVVTASATEHPELFWGLRGGGGNFGIVSSFEYRLHPVGPIVLAGGIVHPFEQARDVLRCFRDQVTSAPDELTVVAGISRAGTEPHLPERAHGQLVVTLAVCWAGDLYEGERALRPLRAFGKPLADLVGPMPYTELQSADAPSGLQNYWNSSYLDALTDEAIEVAIAHASRMTSPLSSFYFEHLQGAIGRVGDSDTAFGHRDAAFDFNILSVWPDPATSAEHISWSRDLWAAMQPFASGVYVNNLGAEGEDRVRAAYTPAAYQRLVALKDRYDPANLFRYNQNIRPSAQSETGSRDRHADQG